MKLETILNALVVSHYQLIHHWGEYGHNKRYRQRDAFRARILGMDDYKNEQEAMLRLNIDELYIEIEKKDELIKELQPQVVAIDELLRVIAEKDTRIAELEGYLKLLKFDDEWEGKDD